MKENKRDKVFYSFSNQVTDLFCLYREQLPRHPHQEDAIHGPWHGQQQTRAASQGITAPHLLSLPFPIYLLPVPHSLTYLLASPLSSLSLHLHLSLLSIHLHCFHIGSCHTNSPLIISSQWPISSRARCLPTSSPTPAMSRATSVVMARHAVTW
jgi:hypothetical protein